MFPLAQKKIILCSYRAPLSLLTSCKPTKSNLYLTNSLATVVTRTTGLHAPYIPCNKSHAPFPSLTSYQRISPGPRHMYEGGAYKSLARPASRCGRTESTVVGKRGLFMCPIAGLFLFQRLKGSMSGDARDFNKMETRAIVKFFSCKARSRRKFKPCTIVCNRKKLGGPV